jgi:molybdopterin molybdotransferase/putative molybdopterin biosynthesis protein
LNDKIMKDQENRGFDTITRKEALDKLFALWNPPLTIETVPLEDARARITAEDLYSRLTLPLVRSSNGDGIAVCSAAFAAGPPDTSAWVPGKDYVRADTGDDFDDRFDAVVMIELVSFDSEGGISLPPDLKVVPGLNISGAGNSVLEGELLLKKGLPLRAYDLSALALGGLREAPVVKKPRVAFIPTGSELIPAGQIPKRGQNIDTNSILVRNMLLEMGAEPLILPIVKDDPELLKKALDQALDAADAVIINGGSSKGAEDHNARLLAEQGRVICHGVNAAPGRPICIAVIGQKPVVNLPGPMVAAYYGMDWCIRGIVCRLLHIPPPERRTVTATLKEDIFPGRTLPDSFEFLSRVELTRTGEGYEAWPVPFKKVPGRRTVGFHSGQCIARGPDTAKGCKVEVELLYGPEFIPVE